MAEWRLRRDPTPWLPPKPRLTPPQPLSAGLNGGHPASEANALPQPLGRSASCDARVLLAIANFLRRAGVLCARAQCRWSTVLRRLAQAGAGWPRLAQNGRILRRLTQIGAAWRRLAQISADLLRLAHVCRARLRLVQDGSGWQMLAQARADKRRLA